MEEYANNFAPDFELRGDTGDIVRLSDFPDKRIVLYFYPKDDTPGCTKQAIAFTESESEFAKRGVVVIGVSKDSVADHQAFKKKHNLSVLLVSDEDASVCEKYGVWGEKTMFGKKHMGITRTTFLLDTPNSDSQRQILHTWHNVKVPDHDRQVLKYIDNL